MPNLAWTHRTLYQLNIIGQSLACQIVNVFHFEATTVEEATLVSDDVALASADALADDWLTNGKGSWTTVHGPDYKIDMVSCQVVERPGLFRHRLTTVEKPQTTANVGIASSDAESPFTAFLLRWRTPVAGKSHRGRTYVGPVPQTWIVDGQVAAANRATCAGVGTTYVNRWGVSGASARWKLTVYSRPYNEGEYQYATRKTGSLTVTTPPDYAGNSTNVTASQFDPILRVQRRREVGVGA